MRAVDRIKQIEEQKKTKDKGGIIGLPLYDGFPRLGEVMPSLTKGLMVLVTANSGVGKTQLWKNMFLLNIIRFFVKNKDLGIKVKFLLFLLEENEEEFIDSLFSMILYEKYGIAVDKLTINSLRKESLTEDTLKKLKEVEGTVDLILDHVEIVDSIYNPTGVYKYCRNFSERNGKHHSNIKEFIHRDDNGKEFKENVPVYSHYEKADENLYPIVVVDNMNLFSTEQGLNRHATMGKWSFDYCRKQISKHWGYPIINVVQQNADSEKQEFTYKGDNIVNRLKPSLDGLGNNKEIGRDHLVVLGLFNPSRYELKTYRGYDISRLKNHFRSLLVIKNRLGVDNVEVPLYFHGACSHFRELPLKMTENDYANLLNKK